MSIIGSNILAGASGQATGYNINNSLRFRASNSAYLSRTFTTPTNNKIFTLSSWVKRGALGAGQFELFTAGTSGSNYVTFQFGADKLNFVSETPTLVLELRTTQVFRDPSAWYHIVLAVDTTQATSTNRVKIYVNGTQITSFSTATYPAQNLNLLMNSAVANYFGYNLSGGGYYDGYLTEANFVDGQQLTPSSFGETDTTTGSWKPKAYTSTYGTNGFYLKFADASAATAAAIGKDSSGNGNNWTPSGISVTAGVTYDAMIDVPTNTSATVGNYATWNPLSNTAGSLTNGNLTFNGTTGVNVRGNATIAVSSGKWYFESTLTTADTFTVVGIGQSFITNQFPAQDAISYALILETATSLNNNVSTAYGTAFTTNDVFMCAFDLDNNKIFFGKNGTWFNSSDPAAGTSPAYTLTAGTYSPIARPYGSGVVLNSNFGQRPFTYTPPTGFVRLNTYNLPTPTILQGNKYMDAVLWTGDGAASKVVTGVNFAPDFLWGKNRVTASIGWWLYDTTRGAGNNKELGTHQTLAEGGDNEETYGYLSSFDSAGFTGVNGVGSPNYYFNQSSVTYVAYAMKANGGTTSSNTSGSITSTVQANATAGFSVATFTGNGTAGATIGHGLGVAPKMIIVKSRSATGDWWVYHASIGATKVLFLSLADAELTFAAWNNTAPTSSVFTIGSAGGLNVNSVTQVAYCWAEIEGFSKFGSYTGNGSTDGNFVYLGFRPKYILFKNTSIAEGWNVRDTSRDTYNASQYELYPYSSAAEANASGRSPTTYLDILSNGFKLRSNNAELNNSTGTNVYIYAAFAENPFKNANAR